MFNPVLNDFTTKEQAIDASMQLLKGLIIKSLKTLENNIRGGK